jgi:hypothetical protein
MRIRQTRRLYNSRFWRAAFAALKSPGSRVAGLLVMMAAAGACSVPPERSIVDEFFAESRLRDKTALQHVATVAFEPQVNGIVESFKVKSVIVGDTPGKRTKSVTVDAQVKLPDGRMTQRTIILILAFGAPKNDPTARDRWIVTGFVEPAAAPQAIPPS